MRLINQQSTKCVQLTKESFIYQSSEQYLILCLEICNLITKYECQIEELIDFDAYHISNEASLNSSLLDEKPIYMLPQLLYHLNETECKKYANRESYKLSLFICGILLCLLILILNAITFVTIIRSSRLRTISNILIANLSISDFLAGLAFLYPCTLNLLTINALETYNSYLYSLACNIRQFYYLCLVGYSPMITSMLTSILTLTLLASEKYMSILHPFVYERLIQDRKCLCYLCLLFVWMISIFFSLLPMMGWNDHKYSIYRGFNCNNAQSKPCMFERIFTLDYILCFTSICGLCALFMLGMYIRIYFVARAHSVQINQMKLSFKRKKSELTQNDSTTRSDSKHDRKKLSIVTKKEKFQNKASQVTLSNLTPLKPSSQQLKLADFISSVEKSSNMNRHFESNCLPSNELDIYCNPSASSEQYKMKSIQTNSCQSLSESKIMYNKSSINKLSTDQITTNECDLIQVPNNSNDTINNNQVTSGFNRITKNLKANIKALKTLLILCLGFYSCWLPLIVYFLAFASKQYDNSTIHILMFVACCNALIDPLVHGFNNKEFCKVLFSNFMRKRSNFAIK